MFFFDMQSTDDLSALRGQIMPWMGEKFYMCTFLESRDNPM